MADWDMHDDETTRVPPERQLARGAAVTAVVACHHVYGMGVRVREHDQFGHVEGPYLRNNGMFGEGHYPPIGQSLTAVVLGYTPVGQLRLTTRLKDLPGYSRTQDDLPE